MLKTALAVFLGVFFALLAHDAIEAYQVRAAIQQITSGIDRSPLDVLRQQPAQSRPIQPPPVVNVNGVGRSPNHIEWSGRPETRKTVEP